VRKKLAYTVMGALAFVFAATTPSMAANAPSQVSVSVSHASTQNIYRSDVTIHFDKAMSAATATRVKAAVARDLPVPETSAGIAAAGPKGAFLYCNVLYRFSDGDGTFTFQHKCGGTTGPWGYKLISGLCSIVISDVKESGMAWTRNGKKQGNMKGHLEYCGYQLHGNFNPDHDYDFITYSDNMTFRVEVGGQTGSGDVRISGSFTSAGCSNRIACGP
jgi:hypothetical protein